MRLIALIVLLLSATCAWSGTPEKSGEKRIPPAGISVPEADEKELAAGAKRLDDEIAKLRAQLAGKPALDLLPDVQIYFNAIHYALTFGEFLEVKDIAAAKVLLKTGLDRAKELREGKPSWTTASGIFPRGYMSKIDHSVQPYGLVIPESFKTDPAKKRRLDFWFHGRDEKLTEVRFLASRHKDAGEFVPADTFVVHLYGRFCNANRFAGEMDLFETLENVKKNYAIDDARIVVRGFSMGGAACWQFGSHHPGLWAAIAPGAGFSETAEFTRAFQSEPKPTWFEQKLWRWYDSTDYAVNHFNTPTVAYSGEIDKQKQAADAMAKAMKEEGLELTHLIGPQTPHKYHPESKKEINAFVDAAAAKGNDPFPPKIRFTTWMLRYNKMKWVIIDGLEKHWERARVDAEITKVGGVAVKTQNVSALTLAMSGENSPLRSGSPTLVVDGQSLEAPAASPEKGWTVHLQKAGGTWTTVPNVDETSLRKRHGLQGPIDDAFMSRFILVTPTGKPFNEKSGAWVSAEQARVATQWRSQFRGVAPVKKDSDITEADIADSNLILWGDPGSNKILAQIADKLAIKWDDKNVSVGAQTFSSQHHIPVMIYPNPLNPKRYIVLNSGFTFRESAQVSNARQIPVLPDYAVIDINTPPNSKWPGAIADVGFFGEKWEVVPQQK